MSRRAVDEQLGFDLSAQGSAACDTPGLALVVPDRRRRREALAAALVALVVELRSVYPNGLTVEDIRSAGVAAGILSGSETGRELSWLSRVPVLAKMRATKTFVRAKRPEAHGNLHRWWVW